MADATPTDVSFVSPTESPVLSDPSGPVANADLQQPSPTAASDQRQIPPPPPPNTVQPDPNQGLPQIDPAQLIQFQPQNQQTHKPQILQLGKIEELPHFSVLMTLFAAIASTLFSVAAAAPAIKMKRWGDDDDEEDTTSTTITRRQMKTTAVVVPSPTQVNPPLPSPPPQTQGPLVPVVPPSPENPAVPQPSNNQPQQQGQQQQQAQETFATVSVTILQNHAVQDIQLVGSAVPTKAPSIPSTLDSSNSTSSFLSLGFVNVLAILGCAVVAIVGVAIYRRKAQKRKELLEELAMKDSSPRVVPSPFPPSPVAEVVVDSLLPSIETQLGIQLSGNVLEVHSSMIRSLLLRLLAILALVQVALSLSIVRDDAVDSTIVNWLGHSKEPKHEHKQWRQLPTTSPSVVIVPALPAPAPAPVVAVESESPALIANLVANPGSLGISVPDQSSQFQLQRSGVLLSATTARMKRTLEALRRKRTLSQISTFEQKEDFVLPTYLNADGMAFKEGVVFTISRPVSTHLSDPQPAESTMSFVPVSFVFDTTTPAQDPEVTTQTSATEANFMEDPTPTAVPAPIPPPLHPQPDQDVPTAEPVNTDDGIINSNPGPAQIFDSYPTATDKSAVNANAGTGKPFLVPFQPGTTSSFSGPQISVTNHNGGNNTTMMTMIAIAGIAIVVIAGVFMVAVQKRRRQNRHSLTAVTPDPGCCFPAQTQRNQGFRPPVYGLGRDVEMGNLDDEDGIVRVGTTIRNLYNETLAQSSNGRRTEK
ncbi:UNVERIFIED_CONTAM: hypothetical protein HDU68_008863 [Siphonaria sp. JEL0065]|nr:hypothetical protein HDU68_008863 [Siphonaria sp. JEL0065]